MENPIGNASRRRRRHSRLGPAEHCASCAEQDERALLPEREPVVCYECDAVQGGRSPVEDHHPAGQHNHPATVSVLGNDHRILSDMQLDWPRETLRNPEGSPLLRAAACLRGWIDVLQLVIYRTVGWIPGWLEQLDAWLIEKLGPGWWAGAPQPMGGFA